MKTFTPPNSYNPKHYYNLLYAMQEIQSERISRSSTLSWRKWTFPVLGLGAAATAALLLILSPTLSPRCNTIDCFLTNAQAAYEAEEQQNLDWIRHQVIRLTSEYYSNETETWTKNDGSVANWTTDETGTTKFLTIVNPAENTTTYYRSNENNDLGLGNRQAEIGNPEVAPVSCITREDIEFKLSNIGQYEYLDRQLQRVSKSPNPIERVELIRRLRERSDIIEDLGESKDSASGETVRTLRVTTGELSTTYTFNARNYDLLRSNDNRDGLTEYLVTEELPASQLPFPNPFSPTDNNLTLLFYLKNEVASSEKSTIFDDRVAEGQVTNPGCYNIDNPYNEVRLTRDQAIKYFKESDGAWWWTDPDQNTEESTQMRTNYLDNLGY